jgi:hypothetical protein
VPSFGKAGFRKLVGAVVLALFLSPNTPGQTAGQTDNVKPIPIFQGSAGFITDFDAGDPHLAPMLRTKDRSPGSKPWLQLRRQNQISTYLRGRGQVSPRVATLTTNSWRFCRDEPQQIGAHMLGLT